jgi:23S rRNA pseudouridine1911/1915/1917 synthase
LNQILPVPGPLDIVWQDEHLLVINKSAGVSVHPSPSLQENTLVHYLLHHFPEVASLDSLRPGIVHRLDKDTSGLMVVVLCNEAHQGLVAALSQHRVTKQYLTIVHGCPEHFQGTIDLPVGRDPKNKTRMAVCTKNGKQAKTHYEVLYVFPKQNCSLLRVNIETGRTHQIRVHCAWIGHPVLGDKVYGPWHRADLKRHCPRIAQFSSRQMLHSWKLGFDHPISAQRLDLRHKVPRDMFRVLVQLRSQTQVVGVTGQVGCGKSSLTRLTAGVDTPHWNADKAVEELYLPGNDGWEMLRRSFGQELFQSEAGPVDKQKLFQRMKESPAFRKELNALVHPLVERHLLDFCQKNKDSKRVLAEVPLLIEAGWHLKGLFDVVVGVFCPRFLRWQWLHEKRGWDEDMIVEMESWQFPIQDKLRSCDLIVSNDGEWRFLEKRACSLRHVLQWVKRRRTQDFLNWLAEQGIWEGASNRLSE